MKEFARKNNLYLTYTFIFICLFFGLISDSGLKYVHYLYIYFAAFCIFSYLLSGPITLLLERIGIRREGNVENLNSWSVIIFASTVAFILVHYIAIRQVPLWEAWKLRDDVEIAMLRNNITLRAPVVINYVSSFVMRAALPFFIYYFYRTGQKKMFWSLAIIGAFYAVSMIQKSYVITIFMPLWIYLLVAGKYFRFAALSVFFWGAISLLIISANPFLIGRGVHNTSQDVVAKVDTVASTVPATVEKSGVLNTMGKIVSSVGTRIFLEPGKVMAKWFSYVPSKYPYAKGCAYHFAAPLLGCKYLDFSGILYDQVYPEYAAKGLHGAMVPTSFMYDYVNFGIAGLVYSALLLSILFILVTFVFKDSWPSGFVLNFYFVLILVSSQISTLLFSGGWGLIILLYLVFRKNLNEFDRRWV
jgi:hypothetical protein